VDEDSKAPVRPAEFVILRIDQFRMAAEQGDTKAQYALAIAATWSTQYVRF
jgi:hypothetical protein